MESTLADFKQTNHSILGTTLGLGLPFLILAATAILLVRNRRRQKAKLASRAPPIAMHNDDDTWNENAQPEMPGELPSKSMPSRREMESRPVRGEVDGIPVRQELA